MNEKHEQEVNEIREEADALAKHAKDRGNISAEGFAMKAKRIAEQARSGFERENYKLVGFVPAEKFREHVTRLAAL